MCKRVSFDRRSIGRQRADCDRGRHERGRREGSFRTDLPTSWLVTTYYTLVHGAGREVIDGRLRAVDAPRFLTATLLAALSRLAKER
jgi:hypothetical protein